MKHASLLLTGLLSLASLLAHAESEPVKSVPASAADVQLQAKTDQLCRKIERCAWQKLDGDALSAQVQKQLKAGLAEICQSVKDDVKPVQQRQLQDQAGACIDSMLQQSCANLLTLEKPTAACARLDAVAGSPQS